jgi:ribosomal protein S18 acetylase RimI-like enzyme
LYRILKDNLITVMKLKFRHKIENTDPEKIRQIVISTGFFRDDEVDVAVELANEALEKGEAVSGYHFVFVTDNGFVTGFACYGPTPCTQGTFDLYWIVVHDSFRGKGIGRSVMQKVEEMLQKAGARKLYIETSSTPKYQPTRNFYISSGYTEEARLKDFYNPGDDKVIYTKYL